MKKVFFILLALSVINLVAYAYERIDGNAWSRMNYKEKKIYLTGLKDCSCVLGRGPQATTEAKDAPKEPPQAPLFSLNGARIEDEEAIMILNMFYGDKRNHKVLVCDAIFINGLGGKAKRLEERAQKSESSVEKKDKPKQELAARLDENRKKARSQRVEKHYQKIVSSVGKLYSDFQLMADKAGGYGLWRGAVSKAQGIFKKNSYGREFEKDLDEIAELMMVIGWPQFQKADDKLRLKQKKQFRRLLPTRYSTQEKFLQKIGFIVLFIFPDQSQEFYQRMFDDIMKVKDKHIEGYLKKQQG